MNTNKIYRTNLCSQLRRSIAPSRRTLCLFISCSLAIQFASHPCQATDPATSHPSPATNPTTSYRSPATDPTTSYRSPVTDPTTSHPSPATDPETTPQIPDRLSTTNSPAKGLAAQHTTQDRASDLHVDRYNYMTLALLIAGIGSLLTALNSYPYMDTCVLYPCQFGMNDRLVCSIMYALGTLLLYPAPETPRYPLYFKHFITAATFCAATLGPWFTTNLAYYHCVIFTLYITAATNAWSFHWFPRMSSSKIIRAPYQDNKGSSRHCHA